MTQNPEFAGDKEITMPVFNKVMTSFIVEDKISMEAIQEHENEDSDACDD